MKLRGLLRVLITAGMLLACTLNAYGVVIQLGKDGSNGAGAAATRPRPRTLLAPPRASRQ